MTSSPISWLLKAASAAVTDLAAAAEPSALRTEADLFKLLIKVDAAAVPARLAGSVTVFGHRFAANFSATAA